MNEKRPRYTMRLSLIDNELGGAEPYHMAMDLHETDFRMFSDRAVSEMKLGLYGSMEQVATALRAREERRDYFRYVGNRLGYRLAVYLEDKEGWHGADRQDSIRKRVNEERMKILREGGPDIMGEWPSPTKG